MSQAESKEGKEEVSTAILDSKELPNWLIVEEAVDDDNSVATLHPATMEKLQLFCGQFILIQGNERKVTMCVLVGDETCEESKIRINEVTRSNLGVGLGDAVQVDLRKDVKKGEFVCIVPLDNSVNATDVFDTYLKSYFLESHRPLMKGDRFVVRGRDGMRSVEFKVIETEPAEYCVVGKDTQFCIHHFAGVWNHIALLFQLFRRWLSCSSRRNS